MAYLGVSARVSWMMGRCKLLPESLSRVNRNGVPDIAVVSSLVLGCALFLIGPGWQQVVAFLTAAQMIALAMGPASLLALRQQLPKERGHFRIPYPTVLSALAFVMATWATNWCGRTALEGAVLAIGIPSLLFALHNWRKHQPIETKASLWWGLYLGLLVLDMELFNKGQPLELTNLAHLAVLAGIALLVLPIAVNSALTEVSPHALTHLRNDPPHLG